MRYLLDTNIVSDLVRNPKGGVAERIGNLGEAQICTGIIVTAELRYEATKKGSRRLTNW
jgi:tRNA(fMet)-specific endonuclease VapC